MEKGAVFGCGIWEIRDFIETMVACKKNHIISIFGFRWVEGGGYFSSIGSLRVWEFGSLGLCN